MSRTITALCACAAMALPFAACGDDEDDPAPASSAPTATAESAPPPPAATATATTPATSESDKLGEAGKKGLLAASNQIALGPNSADFKTTGPLYGAIYRDYAKRVSAGDCKDALLALAKNWEAIGAADAAGDDAKRSDLADNGFKLGDEVRKIC